MARYPRRVTSTPTTITVSGGLPAWLPSPGYWSNSVSLNTTSSITTASGLWSAGRTLDQLFMDYTGAVWNPYYGTYGAWLLFGGGHASNVQQLENTVYAWDANTRQWAALSTPTYPGEIGASYWTPGTNDTNSAYPEPFLTYCELSAGIPASNHSRWTLSILPPALGGGTYGSLISGQLAAVHTGGNTRSHTAHKFDCATGTWSRLGPRNETPQANSLARAWVSCTDTARGRIVQVVHDSIYWMDAATATAWSRTQPPGFYGSGFENVHPIAYLPSLDVFVLKNSTHAIKVFTATELYTNTVPRLSDRTIATSGTPPATPTTESRGMCWCPDLGTYGALVCLDYATAGYPVKALYAPADPINGTWTWATLTANNAPTLSFTGFDNVGGQMYSRFQYAPALKSFFVCSTATGNMWCFRPSEIP